MGGAAVEETQGAGLGWDPARAGQEQQELGAAQGEPGGPSPGWRQGQAESVAHHGAGEATLLLLFPGPAVWLKGWL